MALSGIKKNGKIYLPYILSCILMIMMFYMIHTLSYSPALKSTKGGATLELILSLGKFVIAVSVFTALNNIPFYLDDWGTHWFLQDIAETLAFICTLFSVVCATSTVDRYKMIREYYTGIGKWTEERRQETKKEVFGK